MSSSPPDAKRSPEPRVFPATCAPAWNLRTLIEADYPGLLRLNAESRPAVAPIEADDLASLLSARMSCHLAAVDRRGAVMGYLLGYARDSDYRDTEIDELRGRIAASFCYVCQVVVSCEHRGRGIGRALHAAMEAQARQQGATMLCCDVNPRPPNPESRAFHCRLGFREIGTRIASNGLAIVCLPKDLRASTPGS